MHKVNMSAILSSLVKEDLMFLTVCHCLVNDVGGATPVDAVLGLTADTDVMDNGVYYPGQFHTHTLISRSCHDFLLQ